MKYQEIYNNLINRALCRISEGYVEKHQHRNKVKECLKKQKQKCE